MISITKMEKDLLSAKFPTAHIARTMKQKSKRHKYFCEESARVLNFLNALRSQSVIQISGVGGNVKYADRKTSE